MRTKFGFLFAVVLLLAGCEPNPETYDKTLNAFAERFPDDLSFSKTFISKLQTHDFEWILQHVDPSIGLEMKPQVLQAMAEQLPQDAPKAVTLIGFLHNEGKINGEASTQTAVTYLYEYPATWLEVQVAFRRRPTADGGRDPRVDGVHIDPLDISPLESNAFTLTGKSPKYVVMLLFTGLVPLFILFTTVVAARTKINKRKWLWLIFILFGVVSLNFNWTDGSFGVNPLYFQLLGGGYQQSSPYSPILLGVSFPLGAVLFWIRRRKLSSASSQGLNVSK